LIVVECFINPTKCFYSSFCKAIKNFAQTPLSSKRKVQTPFVWSASS